MLQLQLYIEGQEVEMFKDESITLTQNITDVKRIDAVLTDYSRSFTVPASKNNNKIFKHFYNYYIDGYNAKIKKVADLHVNYKPFKKGKVRFEGVSLKNNKPESYKLTFFGDTIRLNDVLGEDKISALTELSAFDFVYNDTNIAAYMNDGLDSIIGSDQIENAVIFPLITHTNRLIYDSSANQNNNVYPSAGTDNNGVLFSQLKPAIRIDAIIKAIQLHYDLEFSDDFFNNTNFAFNNLYLWMHTKSGGLFEDQQKSKQFKSYDLVGNAQDELIIRSNNFAINNTKKRIQFNLDFTVDPGDDTATYNLVIHKNGEEFKRFDSLKGDTKNGTALGQTIDHIEVDNGQFSVFIETSAVTTFDLEVFVQRENNAILGGKKDCSLTSTITTVTDANFSVPANLPEMKVIDLLQGLFKMFNLVAYINDDNVIVIQTLDEYYASSTKLWDFTPYVDSTKSQVDSPIPFRQVNLGYESTKTFLAANFNSINNRPWGQTNYNEDSYFLTNGKKDKFEGETYEIKLPFEHMLFERLNDLNTGDLTKVQWGWHVDDKEQKSAEMPLIFYPIQTIGSSISARNLGGTKVTINSPYMPSNSASVFSDYVETGMSQSINFHAEVDEYALVSNERTLFKTYYEDYVKDLFDERKRITKVTAELPMSITEELQLNDDLRIFDKIYRINSITTNFENGKSELELVNILRSTKFASVVDTLTSPITIFGVPIDISMTDITIDNIQFTADNAGSDNNGFTQPAVIDDTPAPILQNTPSSISIEPCTVTSPTLTFVSAVGSTSQTTFKFEITESGKLCDQENVDEYGFLIADAESTLTATDDIDTLKAAAGVQLIMVNTDTVYAGAGSPLDLTASPRIKEAKVTGLTHPQIKFARFYAKTNVNPDYDTDKNTITAVHSVSTDTGAGTNTSTAKKFIWANNAGLRTDAGYNTIPTKAQIESNTYTQFHKGTCGSYTENPLNWFHNGTGLYPEVGDRVSRKQTAGVPNYTGGTNSFQSVYGQTTYFAISLGDNLDNYLKDGKSYYRVIKQIVIEYSTAEVVAVYDCSPTLPAYKGAMYFFGAALPLSSDLIVNQGACNIQIGIAATGTSLKGTTEISGVTVPVTYVPDFQIAHNGTGNNPEAGDQIRFTRVHGIDINTSFNGDQTNIMQPNQAVEFGVSLYDINWGASLRKFDYHLLYLLDDTNRVKGVVSINKLTGTVVNATYCPSTF
jgi:hypothetical protein